MQQLVRLEQNPYDGGLTMQALQRARTMEEAQLILSLYLAQESTGIRAEGRTRARRYHPD